MSQGEATVCWHQLSSSYLCAIHTFLKQRVIVMSMMTVHPSTIRLDRLRMTTTVTRTIGNPVNMGNRETSSDGFQ